MEELVRRKYAVTTRPRGSRGQEDDSRNVPAEVKRIVYVRDRGCCVFVGSYGRKCGERAFVDRGRDAGFPAPPAQIRACAASALGSCLR